MNALKVLLILTFMAYFLFFERGFLFYYLCVVLGYYIIVEVLYFNNNTTPKHKLFNTMRTHPFNNQIIAKFNFDLTRVEKIRKNHMGNKWSKKVQKGHKGS